MIRYVTLASWLVIWVNCSERPVATAQEFDPSSKIVSAMATVLDEAGNEIHFSVPADQVSRLLKAAFPAKPRADVQKTALAESPLGAIAFYHGDNSLTRVRFYASGKRPLLFDIKRQFYSRIADSPSIDQQMDARPVKNIDEGLKLQSQLRSLSRRSLPSPDRPVFVFMDDLKLGSMAGLGTYLERRHAVDPNEEKITYSFGPVDGPKCMPKGALSIDPDTGDLYLSDPTKFPRKGGSYKVNLVATNASGLVGTGSFMMLVSEFENSGFGTSSVPRSHRDGLVIDLRPTSVSASGKKLFTTLLIDGKPAEIGQQIKDVENSYQYGVFEINLDGRLLYRVNRNLFRDRAKDFRPDPNNPQQTILQRKPFTVVLVTRGSDSEPWKVLATKQYNMSIANGR